MPEPAAAVLALRAGATVFSDAKSTLVQTGPRPLVPGGSGAEQLGRTVHALEGEPEGVLVAGAVPFDLAAPGALRVGPAVRTPGPLTPTAGRLPARVTVARSRPWPTPARYAASVRAALERIDAGEVQKVVLARSLELTALGDWSVPQLVAELAARNPAATTLAVPVDDPAVPGGRWLVGASPELLLRRRGPSVLLRPLAGSVPRSPEPAEDLRRADALMASDKDRREHAYVVEAVVETLRPLCRTVSAPEPELLATPTVWHLATRITALLNDTETTSVDLVAALHPTPAVGGSPRGAAAQVIREVEEVDRGCYAGAVGWQDGDGDGEWVVGVRCAEVAGNLLRILGGAGIVAGSDPEAEVRETAAKMRTVLEAAARR
ncbi:isochorismate synthase [Paenibacillus sp. TRM 82003]|uniref:isochorismate synthase n=1 Tax=Kineococcus sp. TRM81007 TaxID=2925831 RepID=UPI001F575082|nr:isochorismate synthase [Kineococcus sp. TRM81007]MCI2238230.1 isochorismate synthase [Kineococcus sp. TRM81007]MCI3924098.1 isochorismate synthase [Paenibacillus sp. TRM 82003]